MPNYNHNNNKSKDKILRIEQDIRALRAQNKTHDEVMAILKIPLRSYRRYCSSIAKQDREIWHSIVEEQLSSELLHLKSSLEETYRVSLEMALDPECKDKIEALHCKDDARLSIVQLLQQYSEFKRQIQMQQEEDSNEIKPYIKRVHS